MGKNLDDDDTVFHYCDANAFLNIFQSGKIRLSRSDFMNDSHECKLLDSALEDFFHKKAQEEANEEPRGFTITKTGLGKDVVSGEYAKPFIACFSHWHDKLSQWRGYGDNGAGFAVGYSVHEIGHRIGNIEHEYNDNNKNPSRFMKLFAENVMYIEKIEEKFLPGNLYESLNEQFSKHGISDFMYHVRHEQAFAKSESFREENEYRIVAVADAIDRCSGKFSELKFRASSNGAIIPYYELTMPPPSRIIIGPKNPLTVEQLDFMLWRMDEWNAIDSEKSNLTYK